MAPPSGDKKAYLDNRKREGVALLIKKMEILYKKSLHRANLKTNKIKWEITCYKKGV